MRSVRVALIGAGRLGVRHAQTLATRVPQAELAVVADTNGQAAERLAATLSGVAWSGDPLATIADRQVEAVVIVTPTTTHAELIGAAAAAGKDIFCEKPITLDLASTDAVLEAVQRAGVRFQIGFQRRYDPDYRRIQQLVQSGQLGTPMYLRATLRDTFPPPAGYLPSSGGIFVDMGVHDFDAARFVLGSEVTEVYAMAAVRLGEPFVSAGDADTGTVALRFASGVLGQIDLSRQTVYGYDIRLEVQGSQATARIDEQRNSQVSLLTDRGHIHDYIPNFPERFAPAYAAELASFVEGVVTRAAPLCTGHDGRQALRIALAATESWRTNRPVAVQVD